MEARFDDGDNAGALKYAVLYRDHCPPPDRAALDARIVRLRTDLGLGP
jgi:hypothetical protein